MPPRKQQSTPSPDPLEANLQDDNLDDSVVEVTSAAGQGNVRTSARGGRTPTRRAAPRKPVVTAGRSDGDVFDDAANGNDADVETVRRTPGRKRKAVEGEEDNVGPSPSKRRRTPTAKAASSTPRSSRKTPVKAEVTTPTKSRSNGQNAAASARKTPSAMVASLQATAKPSPRRGRPPLNKSKGPDTMPSFDEAFGEPDGATTSTISREQFLANEALRRQREARNFVFEGDAEAPRLTRSGRVVKKREVIDQDGDENGDEEDGQEGDADADADADHLYGAIPDLDKATPIAQATIAVTPALSVPARQAAADPVADDVQPLPTSARPHVVDMLATLTGQSIATHPAPFHDEAGNETLQGLVNLLRGTVERGEGNSALVVGPRGSGKTRTLARALNLLPSSSSASPIIVSLSGHAQVNDRLAIREMGRQIAEAEGHPLHAEDQDTQEDADGEEYAPTTLPSHLLALLTASSPRAIIIIMEEFDMFTEHARQALLYCLLDVVQSVKTGPVESTGRGVAVVGVTTRTDTLLLLEKRVKSRFSHRIWRVQSPLAPGGSGWYTLLQRALVPWKHAPAKETDAQPVGGHAAKDVLISPNKSKKTTALPDKAAQAELDEWKENWEFAIDTLLKQEKVTRYLNRLSGLTTDVRALYRPFILPVAQVLGGTLDWLTVAKVVECVLQQVDGAGWGLQNTKLKGLPQPPLGVLVIAKHLMYAGKHEFNFAQIEEEYLRFSRTRLVGSGRTRWPSGILRMGYDHLRATSLLVPVSGTNVRAPFARVRCTLAPHEVVAWFKGEGKDSLGPEMAGWGRVMGGHA